jgi:hypothetical protein
MQKCNICGSEKIIKEVQSLSKDNYSNLLITYICEDCKNKKIEIETIN